MQSMTGYGRCRVCEDGRELTLELKAVNHRFLDISFRLPKNLAFLEDALRTRINQSNLRRGHLDVFVTYRNSRADARKVSLDAALAAAYRDAMAELSAATGVENKVSLYEYAQLPDVLTVTEQEEDRDAVSELLCETLLGALKEADAMRLREGEALKKDLTLHLGYLEDLRQKIAARAPGVTEDYRVRLLQRIEECGVTEIDQQRLIQEVAIFADRAAIDEEISRLDSHIRQAHKLMDGKEMCGSKLNFLVQEMNREVNTIGSKAMDADIAKMVVDAKSEIEKLREQIQNVE